MNGFPAARSEYFTLWPPPLTTPFATERLPTGTPSFADAMFRSSALAAAAAPRMLVAPIAVKVDELPTVKAESDTFVSTFAAVTWSTERPSSSAAIIRTDVGVP